MEPAWWRSQLLPVTSCVSFVNLTSVARLIAPVLAAGVGDGGSVVEAGVGDGGQRCATLETAEPAVPPRSTHTQSTGVAEGLPHALPLSCTPANLSSSLKVCSH